MEKPKFDLDRDKQVEYFGRLLTVFGKMMEGVAHGQDKPATLARGIAKAGSVVSGVLRLAIPKTVFELTVRNVVNMGLLLSVILVVVGIVTAQAILTSVGVSLFVTLLALALGVWLLQAFVTRGRGREGRRLAVWLSAGAVLSVILLFLAAGYGVAEFMHAASSRKNAPVTNDVRSPVDKLVDRYEGLRNWTRRRFER